MKLLNKRMLKPSLIAASLLTLANTAQADTLVITNAKVHTATTAGILKQATVVIDDGIITAVNADNKYHSDKVDRLIDAKGQTLTPGLIAAMNGIGLSEVSAVSTSNDGGDHDAGIDFDISLAYNPKSSVVNYTRKGGVTSSLIAPSGGDEIFKGQLSLVNLSGELEHSIEQANIGVLVAIGANSKGSRAMSLQTLQQTFTDHQQALAKAAAEQEAAEQEDKQQQADEPADKSAKEKVLDALLAGDKTLVVKADRASDLLHLIKLKQEFNLKLVIQGAADAIRVAKQLAAAEIPLIINPMVNLPHSFDGLRTSLNRAADLTKAGIELIFIEPDLHNAYQLRFFAGNAVSYGVSKQDALAAVTSNIAKAFDLDTGSIEVGKRADLVLWQGDLFDYSGYVDKLWINGLPYSLETRADKLRDRYINKSKQPMPTGYYK